MSAKPKHTPGPWDYDASGKIGVGFRDGGILLAEARRQEDVPWEPKGNGGATAVANAARIVACVNACEGIADPGVVPELLRFVKETLAGHSFEEPGKPVEWSPSYMERLIARAEGRS